MNSIQSLREPLNQVSVLYAHCVSQNGPKWKVVRASAPGPLWITEAYSFFFKMSGILYMQRISINRVQHSAFNIWTHRPKWDAFSVIRWSRLGLQQVFWDSNSEARTWIQSSSWTENTRTMKFKASLCVTLLMTLFMCCNTDTVDGRVDTNCIYKSRRIPSHKRLMTHNAMELPNDNLKTLCAHHPSGFDSDTPLIHLRGGSSIITSEQILHTTLNTTQAWIKKHVKLSTICCIVAECAIAHPVRYLNEICPEPTQNLTYAFDVIAALGRPWRNVLCALSASSSTRSCLKIVDYANRYRLKLSRTSVPVQITDKSTQLQLKCEIWCIETPVRGCRS
jgi:hypothetical protein